MPLICNSNALPYYEPPRNKKPEYKCSQNDDERIDLISDIMAELSKDTVAKIERCTKQMKKSADAQPGGSRGFGSMSATESFLLTMRLLFEKQVI